MPPANRLTLRNLLRSAPKSPSADDIAALVDALVADAETARHPLMSLAATLRYRAGHIDEAHREEIRSAAAAALLRIRSREVERVSPSAPPIGEWLMVREAAPRLGITEETLLERLRQREHRRRLGWPMWDGYRWWIATAAVDPERRAAFLSAQPSEEPLPELLPASCRPNR